MYRVFLSPLKNLLLGGGGCCRFTPSCSCYAHQAISQAGVVKGLWLAVKRLSRCHPWGGFGYDPAPGPVSQPSVGKTVQN
ncbi:MAG: membrane protein insertion efficiency factor YidD [Verrucomicrobiota bacterium]|nr:membrane protein insertion efficiency factor YidD [Verrucomicrobiota bacterium]